MMLVELLYQIETAIKCINCGRYGETENLSRASGQVWKKEQHQQKNFQVGTVLLPNIKQYKICTYVFMILVNYTEVDQIQW